MGLICKNPYVNGGAAFGCGQCLPCRVNRRRVWTHRLILEATCWPDNAFVTLTYDDEHLPKDGSLNPKHMQQFLKDVRRALEPQRIRFFGVGEYGEQSWRPHYHLAMFNMRSCSRGFSSWRTRGSVTSCCSICDLVRKVWNRGNVFLGTLEPQSAGYVAGYVTKKLTDPNHPALEGRQPEFSRQSLRPGIGAYVTDDIASELMRLGLDKTLVDVPYLLAHGRQKMPLGSYLRRQIRKKIGRDEKAPPEAIKEWLSSLSHLRESDAVIQAPPGQKQFAYWGQVVDSEKGRRINMEARHNRHRKRGHL